jgi:phosphatidylinositol alpha-mannosyltransferase
MQAELSKRGHETLIITPHSRSFPDVLPSYLRLLGNARDIKSFHTTAQVSISADSKHIDALLEKENFDILHFHEPWVPLLSRQLLTRSTSKNIATFHARLPDTTMSKTIEKVVTPYTKSILRYLDSLTAVSEAAASYVTGLTDEKINIIPNGINLAKYKSVHGSSAQRILYVGRLEKRKGLKYLLAAFKILNGRLPDAELIIAGDGPDREKLEEYVEQEGIAKVKFLGYVSDARKMELFSEAGLFCSPAVYGESFGIVLLEAMAAGLPIVAADNPGYQTVLVERGLLSLVNVRHDEEFARRLELLLTDRTLRRAWQDWADNYVQQFDYPRVVDQYEELYKKVLRA